MKWLLILAMLCTCAAYGQGVTPESLEGTWYVNQLIRQGDTVLDRNNTEAMLRFQKKVLFNGGATFTATDSLTTAAYIQTLQNEAQHAFIKFGADGSYVSQIFSTYAGNPISDTAHAGGYTLIDGGRKIKMNNLRLLVGSAYIDITGDFLSISSYDPTDPAAIAADTRKTLFVFIRENKK